MYKITHGLLPYKQKIWHGFKFGSWQFFLEIAKCLSPIANSLFISYNVTLESPNLVLPK